MRTNASPVARGLRDERGAITRKNGDQARSGDQHLDEPTLHARDVILEGVVRLDELGVAEWRLKLRTVVDERELNIGSSKTDSLGSHGLGHVPVDDVPPTVDEDPVYDLVHDPADVVTHVRLLSRFCDKVEYHTFVKVVFYILNIVRYIKL